MSQDIRFEDAKLISYAEYMTLENPVFEGQTRVDKDGNYKMYFSENGVMYVTEHNILA